MSIEHTDIWKYVSAGDSHSVGIKTDNQFLHGCDRPCIVGNTPALII